MNVLPSPADVKTPPGPVVRRPSPMSMRDWHWLWDKRGRASGDFAPSRERPRWALARPRRMKGRGRAVLLWVLLWYAVVQLFPLLIKDRWRPIGPANEARKWPTLRWLTANDPDRPLLLMLGSSRTFHAFRAGALDGMPDSDGRPMRVYNFGIPATGAVHELLCLRDMLAEGIRPRFLLIEFLPPLLNAPQRGGLTEEGMAAFPWFSARRFLQWAPYLNRPSKRAHAWLEACFAPWYAFRGPMHFELKCLHAGQSLPAHAPIDDWGWCPTVLWPFTASERARRLEVARGGYSPGLGRFHLGKKPTRALRELLDLCRREHIPAALVVMPESSEFRGWYSAEANIAIRGLLDELKRTYGVEIIDAQRWQPDKDFEDGHHLLAQGAEVFTSRLHAELPRLLSQSKAALSISEQP